MILLLSFLWLYFLGGVSFGVRHGNTGCLCSATIFRLEIMSRLIILAGYGMQRIYKAFILRLNGILLRFVIMGRVSGSK